MSKFKEENSFNVRVEGSAKVRKTHPDRIPVIIEPESKWYRSDLPELDKEKYLVPMDLTIGQFMFIIRQRIKLAPEKSIFLFINGKLPPTAELMSTIDANERDEDGYVYAKLCGESSYGTSSCRLKNGEYNYGD